MFPEDRKYTKEHEWVKVEDDLAVVGITDFAQQELGDIVYVELPEVGATFERGDVMGTIESVKAVSELFAPISGEVMAGNAALDEAPETINSDAHGAGWYCKLKMTDSSQLDDLLAAEVYKELAAG